MALLLWLLAALIPCLIGMGALRILYGSRTAQEMSTADSVLTGGIICIGLAEAAHLTAVVLGWSFSRCIKFLGIGLFALLVVAVSVIFLCRKKDVNRKWQLQNVKKKLQPAWIAFFVVAILQLIFVSLAKEVYVAGDITLETVKSFLHTDAVYQVNPLTGNEYTLGMPLRLKILCLPTLYAGISQAFGLAPQQVLCEIIPAFVLIGSFLAYSTVANYFFPEDSRKRGLFMLVVAVLLGAGDYMPGMDGFGVMHSGFSGVTIRAAVLLPYTFGAVLRKKYKLAVLCVLAEACIVWTFYGAGACLFVLAGMLVVSILMKRFERKGRREEAKC